jgi:hypothetical protein
LDFKIILHLLDDKTKSGISAEEEQREQVRS